MCPNGRSGRQGNAQESKCNVADYVRFVCNATAWRCNARSGTMVACQNAVITLQFMGGLRSSAVGVKSATVGASSEMENWCVADRPMLQIQSIFAGCRKVRRGAYRLSKSAAESCAVKRTAVTTASADLVHPYTSRTESAPLRCTGITAYHGLIAAIAARKISSRLASSATSGKEA